MHDSRNYLNSAVGETCGCVGAKAVCLLKLHALEANSKSSGEGGLMADSSAASINSVP